MFAVSEQKERCWHEKQKAGVWESKAMSRAASSGDLRVLDMQDRSRHFW